MKDSLQIGLRITEQMRKDLNAIEAATQINDQQLIKSLLHAAVSHFQRSGQLTFPLQLSDAKQEGTKRRKT